MNFRRLIRLGLPVALIPISPVFSFIELGFYSMGVICSWAAMILWGRRPAGLKKALLVAGSLTLLFLLFSLAGITPREKAGEFGLGVLSFCLMGWYMDR